MSVYRFTIVVVLFLISEKFMRVMGTSREPGVSQRLRFGHNGVLLCIMTLLTNVVSTFLGHFFYPL